MGEGTGLGLSTSYSIVKRSGGDITIDSEPSLGTKVTIYLPRIAAQAHAAPSNNDFEPRPHGGETVIVVDDEPTLRDVMASLLRQQGYTVLEASNGEDALRVAEEHQDERIHLLLTDIVMPLMGGRQLAEQLKSEHPDLKVLYTSGYLDNDNFWEGVPESGAEFMQKPFTPVDLAQRVRAVLKGR